MNEHTEADSPRSPYELWYEFLKRTDQTDWSKEVKRDFVGVFQKDFETWFREVKFNLFAPYGPLLGNKGAVMKKLPVRTLFKGEDISGIM